MPVPPPAADAAAPAAQPPATAAVAQVPKPTANQVMVTSLREIGRVRATTHFCSTLRHSSEHAANAAVAFEVASLATMTDLLAYSSPANELVKLRLERTLEDDLRNLADLSRAGGAELDDLRVLAANATPEQSRELLGLRNSLDGAKSRQHYLVKEIAHMFSNASGVAPFGLIDTDPRNLITKLGETPQLRAQEERINLGQDPEGRFGGGLNLDTTPSDLLGGADYAGILDAGEAFTVLLPDDDKVRSDLADAASHATLALGMGGCSDVQAITNPALPPLRGPNGAPFVPAPAPTP